MSFKASSKVFQDSLCYHSFLGVADDPIGPHSCRIRAVLERSSKRKWGEIQKGMEMAEGSG